MEVEYVFTATFRVPFDSSEGDVEQFSDELMHDLKKWLSGRYAQEIFIWKESQ